MISITDFPANPPRIESLALSDYLQTDVLRLDLLHPEISGNKWFKLKNNLIYANEKGKGILTFGGAHSNHIAATAAAGRIFGIKTIAVIRGEQFLTPSPTLAVAKNSGMHLVFLSRQDYDSTKNNTQYWSEKYPDYMSVPEGGNNFRGISGCKEILKDIEQYDYIISASGTGATVAGLVLKAGNKTKVIGINVLKGNNESLDQINSMLSQFGEQRMMGNDALVHSPSNHVLTDQYAFGGYARYDKQLVEFKKEFEARHKFELDYVYTSKTFWALKDLIEKNIFERGSKILVLHTGGLQGNRAFELRFGL